MSLFPFKLEGDLSAERRLEDRRQDEDAESNRPRRNWKGFLGKALLLTVLAGLLWQWRVVVYGPVWLARAHRADKSDFYLGSTNGISNRFLVLQARNYLTDMDHLDGSGNVTAPESLRPLGVHLDMAWFRHHAPDAVDFNPFLQTGGKFVVSWLYMPGCQKVIWKGSRTDTDWYSLRGRPCFPLCRVSIVMNPDLHLSSVSINPL